MSKFNTPGARTAKPSRRAISPIATVAVMPDTLTHEGAPAYTREQRSELFLTVTSGMIAEDAFYEAADERVDRVRKLVRSIVAYPGDSLVWMTDFTRWLRQDGNMRTAPIVIAAEAVYARLEAGGSPFDDPEGYSNRELIKAALHRADEPGEFLAYWLGRFGKPIPIAVKRALGDVANRAYSEYSLLKYDTPKAGLRFGDVISLTRPDPKDERTRLLFRHAIERRHRQWTDTETPQALYLLRERARWEALPVEVRRKFLRGQIDHHGTESALRKVGATWEWLSGWLADGQGMDAEAWGWVIPQMGYMALLRNLANFDRAGVPDSVADVVAAKLADPEEVARSRQFPFRFVSAYRAAPSDRWKHALGKALTASTANIPALPGRTLVLVDTSGSMQGAMSGRSALSMVAAATLFGVAAAYRMGAVDLYGFATGVFGHAVTPGGSVLAEVERFVSKVGSAGHGTNIPEAVRRGYAGHDRVLIFSDMQTVGRYDGGVSAMVPDSVPIYAFNLNAYAASAIPSGTGNRFELGGLTDATFRLIPNLEAGRKGSWPWGQ